MRLIAALIIAVVMYVAVPLLWQRAILTEVNSISQNSANFPAGNAVVASNLTFDENVINAANPTVTINTEEYEQIAVRSQADEAMRQSRAAQDAAWDATH